VYELLGICLALSALLALNAFASALAVVIWRAVTPRISQWPAAARARLLFSLRVSPSVLAVALVLSLVIPAYLLNEPLDTDERVGTKLLILACVSAAGVLLALWRIARTWLATRDLTRDWMRHAEPVEVEGLRLPAYSIRHRFPVIAVIGVLRPRLFIAAQIFDTLTAEELAAALAHEHGHVSAHDNLKRAVLQAGQDALLLAPLGRSLRLEWQHESELAADEFAAWAGPAAALNLASAIVKISRLIPDGARPTLPAGAHLLGEEEGGLSRRVRNLLRLAAPGARERLSRPFGGTLLAWIIWFAAIATCLFAIAYPSVLKLTHSTIEQVVANLR
jgi:beta-lactamase regulating signal transducer with metallopeptidase domain